jgi:hypothetical protein
MTAEVKLKNFAPDEQACLSGVSKIRTLENSQAEIFKIKYF